MLGIQLLGIVFGLIMLYYTHLHYKRKDFDRATYYWWILVWGIFLLFVVFPKILTPIQASFGFARIMDILMVLGFIFLIAVSYYNFIVVEKLKKKMEKLVRTIAYSRKRK